jgi:hypothetical protein
MEYYYWYMLFALTTAVTANLELVLPVVNKEMKEAGKVDNKYLIIFTCFFIHILVAPLVFLSCIVPSMGERFRGVLQKTIFQEE